MAVVRASSKYQIAIPKAVRTKLGITPGQKLLVTDCDGAIVFTPIPDNPIDYLCGILKDEPSMTAELVRERKQELERE